MILKAFKEKSNQKFIDRILAERKVSMSVNKIDSVGVLLNNSEFNDHSEIELFLQKEIGIKPNKCRFITFSENPKAESNLWDTVFTHKHFGWKGALKSQDLIDFTNTKFDVLICYFLASNFELKQIAAMSQAKFKVGISNEDERLYDLIIDLSPNNFDIFKIEFKKYLTVLNKI